MAIVELSAQSQVACADSLALCILDLLRLAKRLPPQQQTFDTCIRPGKVVTKHRHQNEQSKKRNDRNGINHTPCCQCGPGNYQCEKHAAAQPAKTSSLANRLIHSSQGPQLILKPIIVGNEHTSLGVNHTLDQKKIVSARKPTNATIAYPARMRYLCPSGLNKAGR